MILKCTDFPFTGLPRQRYRYFGSFPKILTIQRWNEWMLCTRSANISRHFP